MARRKSKGKPNLLTESTVSKFMKLANLEDLAPDFKQSMGYSNRGPEDSWEQPGLSRYRSRLLREQDEEEMGAELPPEDVAPDEDAAVEDDAGGGAEAQVEEIVSAIADAIEEIIDVVDGDDE